MKTLARIVIRPNDDGRGDLILGAMMKAQNHDLLAPGMVYEIRECMGDLTISPVGEAAIGMTNKDTHLADHNWCQSVDNILDTSGGRFIMTKDEVKKIAFE